LEYNALRGGPKDFDHKIGAHECVIEIDIQGMASSLEKWEVKQEKGQDSDVEGAWSLVDDIWESLNSDPAANIPIVVHYPVDRVVSEMPLNPPSADYRFDQVTVYTDAIAGRIEFHSFFQWYRAREDLENEGLRTDSTRRDKQLEAVRNAIYKVRPEFSNLRVRRSPRLGMIVTKHGQELDLRQLSDGEKCMLSMIGDIARRLAIANPSLDDPLSGEGVVLIDEIDLHLHPGWQREIIPRLQSTFPNCQFIAATHSPQVLSSAKGATVYLLMVVNGSIKAKKLPGPYGKDTNTILEELMGVTERPPEVQEKILKYFERIENGELAEAEELRQALALDIGEDDPELVRGAVVTRRKEILKK
jgi:predicted ATP-binding protein involved in virulence